MRLSSKYILLRRIHLTVLALFTLILTMGQSNIDVLRSAVKNNNCVELDTILNLSELTTDQEKYLAAICLFKKGETLESSKYFESLHPSFLTYNVRFWLARCHAKLGNDSLALNYLSTIPKQGINSKMLSTPEFEILAKSNEDFQKLKSDIEPKFNIWTMMLGAIALIGFLLSLLFLFRNRIIANDNRWMSLILFSFSIILTSYILMWTRHSSYFPYLNKIWSTFIYLIGPATFLYLVSIFKIEKKRNLFIRHFGLPIICFAMMSPSIFGFNSSSIGNLYTIGSSPHIMVVHLALYTFLTYNLSQNDWQIDTNIKKWSSFIVNGLGLFTLAFVSYFVLVNTSFFNPGWDYAVSAVMAFGILGIGYMGVIQNRVFSSEPIEKFIPSTKYKSSSLTDSARKSIMRKMEILMNEEQVYKENELRLDDLASYLNINRHLLSQIINENYKINFFEFINRKRIAHVRYMLENPKYDHYTIQQLAFEAGFNNKASFNRYFKREHGLTPSAFRIKAAKEGRT